MTPEDIRALVALGVPLCEIEEYLDVLDNQEEANAVNQ